MRNEEKGMCVRLPSSAAASAVAAVLLNFKFIVSIVCLFSSPTHVDSIPASIEFARQSLCVLNTCKTQAKNRTCNGNGIRCALFSWKTTCRGDFHLSGIF